MKNTNVILYTCGAYGNFINWCCSYFSGLTNDINIPLTNVGSVHTMFPGKKHLRSPVQLTEYLNSSESVPFAQMHEESMLFTESTLIICSNDIIGSKYNILKNNLPNIITKFNKIIYIYPTITSCSWYINNQYSKPRLFDELLSNGVVDPAETLRRFGFAEFDIKKSKVTGIESLRLDLSADSIEKILQGWGHTSINKFALWELRELSSNYFYDRCMAGLLTTDEVDILKSKFPDILFIELDQLRDNFNNTIISILDKFEITLKNRSDIDQIYSQWIATQAHTTKDNQIDNIVLSTINNIDLDWSEYKLTFFDELFIQRKLKEQGYDLMCYGLNKFPTNTTILSSLLEKNL